MSGSARRLTEIAALAFALLGGVMFVRPDWAAGSLPWPVSPFLAMTMGGWYLGTAVFAFALARSRRETAWGLASYFWLFCVFQAVVLLAHAGDLAMGEPLAWPYVLAVSVGVVATIGGGAWIARASAEPDARPRMSLVLRLFVAAFAVVVALLALPLLDGYDNPTSIWPGPLELVSARSFSAFFGALALSSALIAVQGRFPALVAYARAGIALDVVILVAALVYFERFDFGAHPAQLLYVGLYVLVAAVAIGIVVYASRPVAQPRAR